MNRLLKTSLILGTLLLFSLPLFAATDQAYLNYRQKLMKSMGAHMGAIGDILKYKLPQQDHIVNHARSLSLNSELIAEAFKKKITQGKTDATPKIWQEWQKFMEAAEKMGVESRALARVAQKGDLRASMMQVKKLGKSCGGCHKPYRKPKEERFKR